MAKNIYKILFVVSLIWSNLNFSMTDNIANQNDKIVRKNCYFNADLLINQTCKTIADRLVSDLKSLKDYKTWFTLNTVPDELQMNILQALCKYHTDFLWQYLSDSITVQTLPENVGKTGAICPLKFSQDNNFLYISFFSNSKIWDLRTNKLAFDQENIGAINVSDKFVVFYSENDQLIKIWDLEKFQLLPIFFNAQHYIQDLKISADSTLIVALNIHGILEIFDLENPKKLKEINANCTGTIVISEDKKFVAITTVNNILKIFNLDNGECTKTIEQTNVTFSQINTSFNFFILIKNFLNIHKLIILDTYNHNLKEKFENGFIRCVSPIFKKNIAYGLANGQVKIFNIDTEECKVLGKNLEQPNVSDDNKNHTDVVKCIDLSSDGKIITTCSFDKKIKFWNYKTEDCIRTFCLNKVPMYLALSPTNTVIATLCIDNEIVIHKIEINKNLATILEEIQKNISKK